MAVKRLHLTVGQAANREMKFGAAFLARNFKHVVAIYDYGMDQSTKSYFLVTPLCQKSLQNYLDEVARLSVEEATDVSLNILYGLNEVSEIIHRDLNRATF